MLRGVQVKMGRVGFGTLFHGQFHGGESRENPIPQRHREEILERVVDATDASLPRAGLHRLEEQIHAKGIDVENSRQIENHRGLGSGKLQQSVACVPRNGTVQTDEGQGHDENRSNLMSGKLQVLPRNGDGWGGR